MSWYNTNSDIPKRLQQLIDSKPSFEQFLQFPDFIELLRGFQPKLLEYLSQWNGMAKEIIRLITQQPVQSDTEMRKFKWPYQSVLIIQTNTTCIINSFFKIDPFTQTTYFVNSFYQFLSTDKQLLPLLCGYFSQFNLVLWNSRYKETVDLLYEAKQPLFLLTKHCYSKAIINILMLYLNLDLTKNGATNIQRTSIKLQIVNILYQIIRNEFESYKGKGSGHNHEIIVQNIGQIIVQIIEKYYLIADGKAMLDLILSQQKASLVMQMMMYGGQIAIAISPIVIWLTRYYCLSSFNTEDKIDHELNRRNQQRLELQPFIKIILELFPTIASILQNATALTLYHSKLLEVFNCALELSSSKLRDSLKKTKYIEILIRLLFKFPNLSIIHKIIEKAFIQLFNSQKTISQDIKKYLFCEVNLIDLTVGEYLSRHNNLQDFKDKINYAHEGYFAQLMRIIKNYSKIQTDDDEINESIMKRSSLWQQFSNNILKPYQQLCYKDLSSYENIKQKQPTQFTIRYFTGSIVNNQQISKKVLQQINRQQSIQQFKTSNNDRNTENSINNNNLNQDKLFHVNVITQIQNQFTQISYDQTANQSIYTKDLIKKQSNSSSVEIVNHNNLKQSSNLNNPLVNKYQQFLNSKKQQVDKQIKLTRNNSAEKRLSANKSRVTSPSPKKKKWDDNPTQQPQQKSTQKPLPVVKPSQNNSDGKQIKKQKIGLTTVGSSMRPPLIPQAKSPSVIKQANVIEIKQQTYSFDQQTTKLEDKNLKKAADKKNSLIYQNNIENEVVQEKLLSSSHLIENQRIQLGLFSKSEVFDRLKDIRFHRQRALKPTSSQFRKIQQKDKILLDFLGIKY